MRRFLSREHCLKVHEEFPSLKLVQMELVEDRLAIRTALVEGASSQSESKASRSSVSNTAGKEFPEMLELESLYLHYQLRRPTVSDLTVDNTESCSNKMENWQVKQSNYDTGNGYNKKGQNPSKTEQNRAQTEIMEKSTVKNQQKVKLDKIEAKKIKKSKKPKKRD
nr:hypothetical protein [Tanacetum cinerariifolium]